MKNYEQTYRTPDSIKNDMITGPGNDYGRGNVDYRHSRARHEQTSLPQSVLYGNSELKDTLEAEKAPYPVVELANMQNRRDDEELVRIDERTEEIANSNIVRRLTAGRELGQLAARGNEIRGFGSITEAQAEFVENNLDLLTANAKADAARSGVEINEGDKAA